MIKKLELAEEIRNEIFKKISAENKIRLAFKINNQILRSARKKIKSEYPNLDSISFSEKLYRHLTLKRKFYENLFNQLLKKELKIRNQF